MKTKASKILNLILIFAAVLSACFTVGLTVKKNSNNSVGLLAGTSAAEFLATASDGKITLTEDVEIDGDLQITSDLTIELGEYQLTVNENIITSESTLVNIEGSDPSKAIVNANQIIVGVNSELYLKNMLLTDTTTEDYAISTSSQSEVYINNTTISGDVYLFETAFMQIGGVCQVGTFHVWPTFNPIYIESGATLNGNTEHSIKINYVKLDEEGTIDSYLASELLTLDLDGRSVVYFDVVDTEVDGIQHRIMFENLEKHMVNFKTTDGGSTLYITEAEVGYKETGTTKYIYTSFEHALQVAQNAGKNWEIYFFKNLDLSSVDAGFTVNSTPTSLTFTTDVVNAGKTDESYTKQTLTVKKFIFDCAINLNSGIVLEVNNGITFNNSAVLNNETSIIVNSSIEAKSNLTLNNSASINGQVEAHGIITLNDSSEILYKGSVGIYLSGASSQVVLGWDSLNGQIRAVDTSNVEKTRTNGVYSDGSADIYIDTWAVGTVAPIVIANNLTLGAFNGGLPIVLNATAPGRAVTVATQQTGANVGLLSHDAFKIASNNTLEDYSLRRNYGADTVNTSDDYLELTNEVNFLIHYSSDVAVAINGSDYSYNLAASLQTLLDAKKGNARAGLALAGYNFDGSENTATIGSLTVEYLKDNGISDIYACYTLTTYGEFKYLSKTEEEEFSTFNLAYCESLPGSDVIKTLSTINQNKVNSANSGFSFSGWSESSTISDYNTFTEIGFGGQKNIFAGNISNGRVCILTAYAVWYKAYDLKGKSSGWSFEPSLNTEYTGLALTKTAYFAYNTSGNTASITIKAADFDAGATAPSIANYTFKGWGDVGTVKPNATVDEWTLTFNNGSSYQEFSVYAVWETEVTFEVYFQNTKLETDLTKYEKMSDKTYSILVCSIEAIDFVTMGEFFIDFTGFSFSEYQYLNASNNVHAEGTDTTTKIDVVKGTFKVYYNRNSYRISLEENTGTENLTIKDNTNNRTLSTLSDANGKYVTGYYGLEYYANASLLSNFKNLTITATGVTLSENTFTMPNNAVTITASATPKGVVTLSGITVSQSLTFGEKLSTLNSYISGTATCEGNPVAGTWAFQNGNITYPEVSDSNVTEYTVVFTPTDTTNYLSATDTVKITVDKATVTVEGLSATAIIYGQSLASSYISATTVNGVDIDTDFEGGNWSFSNSSYIPTAVGDYTATVKFTPIDTTNYETLTTTVTVNVTQAELELTGLSASDITYGQTLADSTVSGTAKNKTTGTNVAGTFAFANGTTAPSVSDSNTTEYLITFTPTANASCYIIPTNITTTLKVKAGELEFSGLTTNAIIFGQTLASSSVSGTAKNKITETTVAGSFVFKDTSEKPENIGNFNTKALFKPTDTTNYTEEYEVDVTVNVTQAELEFTGLSASAITYGQTLANSTVSGTAKNKTTGTTVAGTFVFANGTTAPSVSDSDKTEYLITFTPSENASCYIIPTTEKTTLIVNKATPTFSDTDFTFEYGTTWSEIKTEIIKYIQNPHNASLKPSGVITATFGATQLYDEYVLSINPTGHTVEVIFNIEYPDNNNYNPSNQTDFSIKIISDDNAVDVSLNLINTTADKANNFTHDFTTQLAIAFTAVTGYTLNSIEVKINNSALNAADYTYTDGNLTIAAAKIVGNVEITVVSTDKTKPIISEVKATAYNTLQFKATDGVGIVAYAVTTTASYTGATWNSVTETTNLTKSHEITSMAAGTYHVWVKDAAGNVSDSSTISAYTITAYKGTNSNISSVKINENNNTSIIALSGSQIHISATPVANAAFEGWHTSSTAPASYTLTDNPQEITVGTANANYYAFAKMLTAKYKVEAYLESTTLGTYEITPEYTIDTFSGTIGTQTNVQTTDLRDDITGFNKPTSITQETINADGTTTVKVYYNRKTYTITKNEGANTTLSIAPSADGKYYYGIEYTVTAGYTAPYTAVTVTVTGANYNADTKTLIMDGDYADTVTVTSTAADASDVSLTIEDPAAITYRPAEDNNQTITLNTTVTGGVKFTYSIIDGNGNSYFDIPSTELAANQKPTLTVKAGTPVETYSLTIKATETTSGKFATATISVVINKATITTLSVSPTSKTITYGLTWEAILSDVTITKTAQITLAKGGTFDVDGEWSYDKTSTEKPSARAEAYVVNFTFTPDSNYQLPTPAPTLQVSVTITNRDFTTTTLTFTRNPASETYSGSAHSFTLVGTVKDMDDIEITPTIVIKDSEGNTVTEAVDAGEYTFTYTFAKENYNTITETKTLTITKANVYFVIDTTDPFVYNYNGKTWAEAEIENDIKAKITAKNASYAGVNVAYTPEFTGQPDVLNAGVYTVTVSITPTLSKNYNTPESKTVTITINKIDGVLTFTYSGDKNPDNGNFLLTYGDNRNVTVSGAVGDASFAVMHFGSETITGNTADVLYNNVPGKKVFKLVKDKYYKIEDSEIVETADTSEFKCTKTDWYYIHESNIHQAITYLTAKLTGNTINVYCDYVDTTVKTIYVYAESANYTYVGSFTVELLRASLTINGSFEATQSAYFNGSEKAPDFGDYVVQETANGDNYTIAPNLILLKKGETDLFLDTSKVVGVGKYTFVYEYANATANYETKSITITLTINQAQLSAPNGLTWVKGTAKWNKVTTFVHGENVAGITVSYKVELYKNGTKVTGVGGTVLGTEFDFTNKIKEAAGAYTFTVQAISSVQTNCAHSAVSGASSSQYVTKLLGATTQTGYTLTIGGNTVTSAAGVYIINGESLNVSATMAAGYTFTNFVSSNGAITFDDATSSSTDLTFNTSTYIESVVIKVNNPSVKQYTVNITKGDGVTLEYKVSGAASFTSITTETYITLYALTTYEFKYEVSGGYKFTASLFEQPYTVASKDDITHYQDTDAAQTISITSELIEYTVKVQSNNASYGSVYVNTTNSFAADYTTTELSNLTGFTTTIAYIQATSTSADYQFNNFTYTNGDYVSLDNVNAENTSISTKAFGHEDVTITITANFNLVGQRTVVYEFYQMEKDGTTGAAKHTIVAEGFDLNSTITAASIYEAFATKASEYFVQNGIILKTIKVTLGGVESNLFTATAITNAYENIEAYETNIESDITLTDDLTISFYFERLQYNVTINYKDADGDDTTTGAVLFWYGATITYPTVQNHNTTNEFKATLNYRDYVTANEEKTQTIVNSLSKWNVNGTDTEIANIPASVGTEDLVITAVYEGAAQNVSFENPTRTGYSFVGWFDNVNGTGTAITSITNKLTANVTYYAYWNLNDLTSVSITSTDATIINGEAEATYTGSAFDFVASYSHTAAGVAANSLTYSYIWYVKALEGADLTGKTTITRGEAPNAVTYIKLNFDNTNLSVTNVLESGDYLLVVTAKDVDNKQVSKDATVKITINKATLSLSDLIYIDLDGNAGTTTDQYYLNEYLTTKPLPTLYTSKNIPTIHFKAQNDGSKVSSLAWTQYVSTNGNVNDAENKSDTFTTLFAGVNYYHFEAISNDANFENFYGSFKIEASAVELAGIKASYTVPNGVKIYGSAEIDNLKKLFGAGDVYYLQILLVYNDGTTATLSVKDNLAAITISVNGKTSGKLSAAGISYAENGVCLDVTYDGKTYNNDDPNYSTFITVTEVVIETFTATATTAITDKQYSAFDIITDDISALTVKLIYNDGNFKTLSYEAEEFSIDYPSDAGGQVGFRAGDTSFEVVYAQDQTLKCSITLNNAVKKATLTEESDLAKALQKEYSTEYGKTLEQIQTELLVVNNVKFKTGTDLTPVLNVGEYKNYEFIFNPDTENYEDYIIGQNIITLTITMANLDIAISGNANIAYDGAAHYVTAKVNSYVSASASITIYYSLTPLDEDNYNNLATGLFTLEITDGSPQNLTNISVQNEGDSKTVYYYIVSDNYNVVSGSKIIAISGLIAVTVTISETEFGLTYGTPKSVTITAKETTSGNSVTIDNDDVSIYFGTTMADLSNNTSDNVSVSFNAGSLLFTPGKSTNSQVYVKIIINSTTHGFNTDGYIITITKVEKANRTIHWHETNEDIFYSGEAKNPTKNLVYAPAWETEKEGTANITYSFYKSYTGGTLGELLGITAPIAVGTYYVVAEVGETDYYTGASTFDAATNKVLTFTISVATAEITVAFKPGKTYVYNGQNQTVTQADLIVTINGTGSSSYTISYDDKPIAETDFINAGVYKLVVTSTDPNFIGEAELDWTIAKFTDTTKVSVTTTTTSLTYNGSCQSLANLELSVNLGGKTEILTVGDAGITASYAASDWKNAGEHSVTITANTTNFNFNVTKIYTINAIVLTPADVTFDPATGHKFRWAEGENHTVTASIINGKVVAGDSVVLTLEGAIFSIEGEHTVTVTGTNNTNYIIKRDDSGNSTIKATYYVIRYFNLILDANEHGGYFGEDKTKVQEYANNTQNVDLLIFEKPVREGYTFVGWADNTNTTDTVTLVSINNANKTLYAVYSKDITLTVHYLNNSLTDVKQETIIKTLFNKATKASFDIRNIKTNAENVSPNGYTLKQIGGAGLVIFDLSENTVLRAYYNKPIVLTMVVTGEQSQTTQNAVYKLNELNEFVKVSNAEFVLEAPLLNPGDGKFKAWALKNADDTYTLLEAQNKYTYNKDTAILALDNDLTIHALVEAEVSYGGFIKGIAIFVIALVGLIILLAIFNKNKKRKAVANVPTQSSGSDNVDYGAYYEKSNRHHERISNKLRKEHDNKLMEENYSPLINKNNVNNETGSQATHQPINNSYNTQNQNTNYNQTNSQYNAAQNSANKSYTEYTNGYYNTNNQSNYYGSYNASAQNGAINSNNAGTGNVNTAQNANNTAQNANNNAQSAGNASAGSSDIQSILDKYKNLGSNNSNGGSNNGSN